MRLCMFHPVGHPLERGWVGRVDGDRVVHLAAQTLQSFFTGGGTAREHAEYPLAEVKLLSPVLHPPSIRIFDEQDAFVFANPAAMRGPGAEIPGTEGLALAPRVAADHRRRGRSSRVHDPRGVAGSGPKTPEGSRLRSWSRAGRRHRGDVRARRLRAARTGRRARAPPPALARLRLARGGRACRRSDEALPGRPRRRAELRRGRADRSRRHRRGRRRRDRRTRRRRRSRTSYAVPQESSR